MFRQITRVIGETLCQTPNMRLPTGRFITVSKSRTFFSTNDRPQIPSSSATQPHNKNESFKNRSFLGSWECIENQDGSLTIYNPNIRKTVRISPECAENGCLCNSKVFILKELPNQLTKDEVSVHNLRINEDSKFPTRESEVTIYC